MLITALFVAITSPLWIGILYAFAHARAKSPLWKTISGVIATWWLLMFIAIVLVALSFTGNDPKTNAQALIDTWNGWMFLVPVSLAIGSGIVLFIYSPPEENTTEMMAARLTIGTTLAFWVVVALGALFFELARWAYQLAVTIAAAVG